MKILIVAQVPIITAVLSFTAAQNGNWGGLVHIVGIAGEEKA